MVKVSGEERNEEVPPPPPPRALAISVFALAAACVLAVIRPEGHGVATETAWGLGWLLALVPAFLLSYYRGYKGATAALALGMVGFTVAEVLAPLLLEDTIDWTVYATATTGLLVVSLGLGWMTESLHGAGGHPVAGRERSARRDALQRAVDQGEFELYYQPIVALADDSVAGVEVLVRWDHPRRGLLDAAEFLPFAETTDLAVPLGKWIVVKALDHLDSWLDRFQEEGDFFLNVNVTERQCRSSEFRDHLCRLARRATGDGVRFQVEMAEGALHELGFELQEFRDAGAGLVVDDFGLGPVALGALRRMDVSGIKLEGSLVRRLVEDDGEEARALARSAASIGNSLGLDVVAEELETREQYEAVTGYGFGYGQGYFFADPSPVGALRSHLNVDV